MTTFINPGPGSIPTSGNGWTNTYEGAAREAVRWLDQMTTGGIRDVNLDLKGEDLGDGRWRFHFRHEVTGVVVDLDTHGIDDYEAYERDRVFPPRIYWNGSSCGEPEVEDWATEGFEVVKTLTERTP